MIIHSHTVRLLPSSAEGKGDLFTRLVKDLFFALGYDDISLNIAKSGREVDVQGRHRREQRRLVAECKAHAEPIGGASLNKFYGVVAREREQSREPVSAYFLSLSGFTATGKEQEARSGVNALVLLEGKEIVSELIASRFLVDPSKVLETAGRLAEVNSRADLSAVRLELLGHASGYIWAVTYGAVGHPESHVALIHADGTPLGRDVAAGVLDSDGEGNGVGRLAYLAPHNSAGERSTRAAAAVDRYREWLVAECGFIQLDGLPADSDLSALRLRLERLFVPLRVESGRSVPPGRTWRGSVGQFISTTNRFALLAKPGGGKSTLLRRLAIAYATPERRAESDDDLPDRDWLPLLVRCRDLRDRARWSTVSILREIGVQACLSREEAVLFGEHVEAILRTGQALVLIDGLDELTDEGDRAVFARNLRTFLGMFPTVSLVVTSREAGFRQVAGVIAGACEQAYLAPFTRRSVQRLCENWTVEVLGDSRRSRADARQLSDTIWSNVRVRLLAENPLMLTTLLVVRRSVGELPSRRVELYSEAVRVLVRTWNTEGFAPMELEETLAQLCYVACYMMMAGVQRIGHARLLSTLRQARRELESELEFARFGVEEFLRRIEYRSSLIMQVGVERFDGTLEPVYEFRHLTFQEFLAARGFVEGHFPGREQNTELAEVLARYFDRPTWRELIPLAAALAKRQAEQVVRRLTEDLELRSRRAAAERPGPDDLVVALLLQCILDEVPVAGTALRQALRVLARHSSHHGRVAWVHLVVKCKFGAVFRDIVLDAVRGPSWADYLSAAQEIAVLDFSWSDDLSGDLGELRRRLDASATEERLYAGLALGRVIRQHAKKGTGALESELVSSLTGLLRGTPCEAAVGCLALEPLLERASHGDPDLLQLLLDLWQGAESLILAQNAASAFAKMPLMSRELGSLLKAGELDDHRLSLSEAGRIVLSWYRRGPLTDEEIRSRIDRTIHTSPVLIAICTQIEAERRKATRRAGSGGRSSDGGSPST